MTSPVTNVKRLRQLQATPGGGFFEQNGAYVYRLGDRLLIGGATLNDARFPNVEQDWLTQFQIAAGLSSGTITSTQFAVLNSGNTAETGASGIVGGIQTKSFGSAGTSALGVSAYAINNHATLSTNGWAFYGEAHKTSAAAGSVYGMEVDTRSTVATITPNAWQQGDVVGVQLASGAELPGTNLDASAAIQIAPNPAKFKVGVNLLATAITGTDGATGQGVALSLATGHVARWYGTGGTVCATLGAAAGMSPANATQLIFSDAGCTVLAGDGGTLIQVLPVASAVNNLRATAGASGTSPALAAVGAGTNLDLVLAPKGTGSVLVTGLTGKNYANDAAAAAGGVSIGGIYHNAGAVRVRLV